MSNILKFFKNRNSLVNKNKYKFQFLDKRQKFAVQTIFLTTGLLITQLIWEDYRFFMVVILSLLSYILTAWSLSEDIRGVERILLFILPVFFTASVSLFYFLLPGRWITRLFIGLIFSIGTYAILLVENIYNVAAERSIQLIRAAQSVGLLMTLIVIFFISNIIYSLRLFFWQNLLLFAIFIFFLSLQSLWSVLLNQRITKKLLIYSALISTGIGEIALGLSFWPIENASYSLFITSSYYVITGVIQQDFLGRLFPKSIREFLVVFFFTFILILIITKWGG